MAPQQSKLKKKTENSKRALDEEHGGNLAKKPFGMSNQHTVKATKFSNFTTLHLPLPYYAYNLIKNMPNVIQEKNSWIIKSDIQEEFFKLCNEHNINVEYLNNF